MLYITECSNIPPVDHATATVDGSTPNLPIVHDTHVDFACDSDYIPSETNLMAVCTSGEVDVSGLKCYRGKVLCSYKHQCTYITLVIFMGLNSTKVLNTWSPGT